MNNLNKYDIKMNRSTIFKDSTNIPFIIKSKHINLIYCQRFYLDLIIKQIQISLNYIQKV